MVRPLLVRGMLAGLAGGLVSFVLAYVLGEGPLTAGIEFEETSAAHTTMPGMSAEPDLVSRGVQSTVGLGVVAVLFGVALGGLYGLAFAVAQGRLGAISTKASAAVVALAGFVGIYLLPQLKYPASPPGVNSGDTITGRTVTYLIALVASLIVVAGVVVLARRFAPRLGSWNATVLAALLGVGVIVGVYLMLPATDEIPPGFPAEMLWAFRMSSLAAQAALWATVGLVFGALTERATRRESPVRQPAPTEAP